MIEFYKPSSLGNSYLCADLVYQNFPLLLYLNSQRGYKTFIDIDLLLTVMLLLQD